MNNLPVRNVRTDFATYPLSFGQEMLWLSHKLSNEVDPYNTVHSFLVKGTLDVTCLQIAFQALIERHSALRTIFLESETCPVQKVLPEAPFELAQISASGEIGSELQGLVEAESICRFDLGRAPLLRVTLVSSVGQQSALVIAMHHLICDAWSNDLLLRDLAVAYSSALAGRDDFKAGAESTFGQYAKLQRDLSAAGVFDTDVAYWEESIGSDISRFDILPEGTSDGSDVEIARRQLFHLPSDLATKVLRRSQDMALSPFVLYFAAWQLVLWTYSGRRRLIVGVPYAGRGESSHMDVVGYFVNTLPFTIEVRPEQAIGDFVRDVGRNVIAAIDHAGCPMELVADRLRKRGSLGAGPLFQSLFNFRPQSRSQEIALGEATLVPWIAERSPLKFDLGIDLAVSAASVEVAVEYAEHPGSAAVVPRLIDLFATVLEAISSDDDRCVWNACELPEADAQYLGALSHQGQAHTGGAQGLIHGHIESQAQLAPDAQALVYGEAALSYAELNARANRLAHHLIGLGVGPETKVGVALERSVELVVALLAVLKAGGAYVPLDPSYPAERLAYMMVDSGLELVLTHSVSRQALPLPEGVTALEVDRLDVSARPASNPEVTVHPESLAYVIYTSGSTGRPKGAGNRHGALANRLDWMQQAYGLDSSDTVLQKTPFSFDVSVWEFFWPLMAGARLAVAPPGAHRDPAELVALIERHQVTTLHFVPSMLQAFVAHDGAAQCIGIHRIVCSGEALPAALQDRTLALLPQARLYNLYGPTEAAIDVTHWTCSAGDAVVPIGRPIDNVQTYVLDASMNLAPPGVPGELYLGGAGLGRGYEGKPGLTAERFVPDPYGEDGGRLYRTGDLARWNDAGALEYLGRIDHQVKIRGFRIELGELEAQLQAQPGVREAIVTAQEGPGGARLVGYVTAQAGQVLDTTTLRAHVSAALPDYMVPSGIVVLDALPLSPNGKVDRKALPAPEFASQGYEPPQGDVEKALATIWQEVLGVERVGRHDNFFELGGHSMVAIQLLEYIRRCGWKADARYLFSHPRLSQFALSMIKASSLRDSAAEHFSEIPEGCDLIAPSMLTLLQFRHEDLRRIERGVPGGARNIQDIYPLAPLQEGMLFHHVEQPQGDVYVHTLLLSFSSKDKLLQFAQCLNVLIERHDALRTAVLWEELPEPVQVVLRQATLELEWLSSDESASLGTAVERLASYVDPRTFRIDIRRAPMMRAIAVQDDHEGMWFLKLASHHLVVDHTSVDMLLGEMNLIFAGHQHALQKPIPFRNFIARARSKFQRSDAESFFRGMLADVREPSAPFGQSHVNADGVDVNEAHIELDPRLVATLREQAIHLGVSLAAFLHLAWGLVVAKSTATQDAVFGTVLFGRMGAGDGAERAVGLFINTLPFRVRLNGQRVETCVRQVHGALTQLLQHEHTPLASALRCSGVPAGTPLFSSILNYRYVGDRVRADGTGAWAGIVGLESRERSNYPFTLNVNDSGGGIELIAQVINTVSAQQVCELARDAVVAIANAVKAGSGVGVNDIDILPDVVTAQLLESGARLPRNAEPTLVHERYGEWAHGNPEAMSVVCGTEALTYGELNERTNRLAHHLISLDVGPETKVGVALERSVELVVALLAVLKAGGAYVPLDPSYPADRLAYMMADSGLGLVLTHSMLRQALPLPDGMTTLEIDRLDVSTQPATNPEVTVHPENLAYVIYTSGSTGRPKGAQLTHRNVARLLAATNEWFAFGPSDVWTMFHSYAFDFSVWELFGALCHGGKLVVVPHLVSRSPEEFLGLLRREGVTVLNQTPSAFRQLMQAPGVYEGGLSLRMVIFGGEALDPQTLGPWVEHYGDAAPRLVNMYGITETTVHVTYRPITRADLAGQCSPVGKAIPDLGLYVLDGGGHLLPVGVPGELHVAGDGLARGYLDRAGLTAERFVPDPFDEAGGRLYRTGDLARWSADGELEYLGRFDHQVKIRGFRIELGEVEAQLQAQPGVREVIVTAQEGPGGARLVGYVTAQAGEVLDPATLRVRVSTTVPDYMVPSAIMVLPSLPLTVNGKVDRKALPAPEFASQGYEPPQGDVEAALATIWQDVLGVERVGRHDNFFELGGDSILSLKVVSGAQQAGIPMAVRQLFEHQALQALAAVLHSGGRERTQIPVIPQGERQAVPLSYAQQRQWFLWNLQPQGSAYHIAGGLRFQGGLDVAAVRASFDVLVQRHESLRTTFEQRDEGTAVQVIHDSLPYDYAFTDVTDDGDPSARLRYVAETFGRRPFDLTKGPLLRIEVIRLAEAEHVLLVSMHHIVSDGWSIEVLLKEFVRAYRACRDGQALALPLLPIQYVDYGVWQRSRLESGERERQLTYWRTYLGDQHPVLALPMDHARQALGQYIEAHLALEVPDDLALGIRRLANKHGATPFMVLLSALQILLHRYTGQADIRIGIPNANRDQGETQGVIGFFVNTQVIRTQIDGRMSLDAVLEAVKRGVVGAQAHQDLPFDVLVEALKPERSLSHTPLFQVMHSHQRTAGDVLVGMGGLVTESYPLTERAAQFDLALNTAEDQDGRLSVSFAYARELFAPATIKQLAEHYIGVIRGLASGHGEVRLVSDLAMLDVAQRNQLLAQGRAVASYPAPIPVHDRVESQAQLAPDAQALVYGEAALSYAELNARANRLAHHLIGLGVGPETKVGVALERSVELVVALLAVLKAGGAYVPLDPSYPAERLAYMMVDSGLELVLTHSVSRQALPLPEGVTALEVDRLDVSARPASNPEVTVHPENLAYVIYTSGSTGRPKGAGNRHGALANRLDWMQQAYGLDSSDTVLQKTPFSFDVSVWEFFWPLMAGARLAVAPPGAHRDPAELVALIERHQVTTLHFVPSMLQAFVEHDGAAQCIGIHRIVCSGEALPAALQDRTLALLPQARLYNLYGPTEAAIDVTHWTCSAGDAVVPIGRPIDNVQTYVLDASMNLAPPGVPGELYLGGAGLGRGYEGKPGLTAERFVPDPYGEDGGRLYRTGDLARWNDAGALEYLGRIDHQVKIRGFRIELGELEAQLQAQPGVREAIVTAQEGPGGARLVGYVTAQAGQVLDTTTLRAHVSAALPDYMVPSGIVVLDALPLSPNGKVDRKALPAPEFASQGYEPPQGDVEKALATIWQEVLGVERVGRHDNFFELGGDSILSLKVVSGAQQAGIPMAVRQLFEHQTLQGLATATATSTLEQQPIRKIPPSERQAVPLSYAQQRQWFLWNLQPQGSAYHIAGGLRFQGGLDVAAVRASFDVLVQRHESLRTTFEQRDEGMAVQVIHDSLPYDYAFTDLTGDTDPQARLKHVAEKFGRRPFDLRAGPLLRIEVIRLAEVEHVLLVSMHHIVSDGWSIGVLLKEFVQAYQANLNGLEVSLPAMPIQYADYAVWQRGWLEAGEQERQLAYWQDYLGQEHPVLELPVDHPRLTLGQYGEARVPIELPDDLVSRIRKRAHSQGATPFIVLLSALQILLHRYSGQADIRIGIPNANRGRGETQGTIGFFVNTQVIRTQIHGRMSLSAVLELVKRGVMGAQAHQDLPFDVLVEALKPERSLSHTPLFQVMHNHQRLGSDVLQRLPGIQVESYELHERTAQFELALNTFESQDGGILANFTYAGELFEPATICQLATHYAALLHSLVSDEGICERVGEVALLDAAQREKILGSGRGDVSTRAPSPVHHQVESQVSLTPEAVALVYGDEGLSYAELNERANRLAHHLIGLGVSPETKVGVALERSMELVVALLAVLKAGGAYVPLDPSYPAERLAYMMSDSGLALVLTQSTVRDALPLPEDVAALELDRLDVNGLPHRNPAVKVHPENLAYVIYTSGSTGQPKGVMVRHAALSNFLNSMSDRPGLDAEDVLLGLTSLSFDIAALELFLPLTRGARLVVAPSSAARDAAELRALVECHCVTVMQSTPSGWQVLLAAGEDHLRIRGLCGGEALSADLARRLRDVGVDLWNMYGPTETTVWSTVDHVDDGPIVLGRPVSATQVYVLDHEMNLAPASVAGELYIGGDGVARGYLNRTALTAQRFVPDPFGEAGRRLYRTGDLMRWRTNGLLEYLGRLDHQVKIRGFRIELGEVETQLQAQGGVREAIVTVHEGPSGKRLVGYVTAAASLELDPQQLRAKLGEVVPEYMVPSAIVVLAALPLTPNGKVDRKSLPAPEFALQGYEAPQGEAEEALARIWQEVLSVARVGRHDNFFDLGGDSLGAIRVQWRVSRDLGMECDLATLISAKTLKELKTSLLGEKKISGTTRSQATDKLKEILANVS